MYQIKKRSGELELFELSKIKSSIKRTFDSCNRNYQESIIETISIKSVADAETKIKDNVLNVEDIQDSVEKVLMTYGYEDVAKAYILYRKQHERVRNAKETVLDYKKTVDSYLKADDWRVKENASIDYSLGGLILGNSGAITANYWLSEIYDEEIANAHRNCDIHIHDLSMLSGYCAGWSLKTLIKEGFGKVPRKISSGPAKHLSTICNQMINFLGTMSLEWAGAQAFNSVDTLLAPFVKADNLSYKEVYQCIQSLVFGLNTPSRWGCLELSTQVATPKGFKYCDELSVGDEIYTWVGGTLHTAKLNHIIRKKNESGKLHKYIGKSYAQTVTPDHRCVVFNKSKRCRYDIKHSNEIFNSNKDLTMVDGFVGTDITGSVNLSNEEIMLAAMYYCDGLANTNKRIEITKSSRRDTGEIKRVLDYLKLSYKLEQYDKFSKSGELFFTNRYHIDSKHREYIDNLIGYKYKIDDKFLNMSTEQSKLFIETWAKFDGSINGRLMCQYDNDEIRDALEIIMIRAGYLPHVWSRKKKTDKYPTNYVFAGTRQSVKVLDRKELDYDGDVWCPSTDDGTAIYRDIDGNIFISGNCQPPFTNFTLDWTVPDDLAEMNCIVGGKEVDFKYKDCKREMDMINKAFIEVMLNGDEDGRSFAYPIPTYSITKDFDWDTESINNKLLFEMTAKYGIPYFSNYINSDMNPSDTRSMAILGTQNVIYKDKFGRISKNEIRHLVKQWIKTPETQYSIMMNGKFVDIIDMFEVPYEKYDTYIRVNLANGQSQSFSYDHKCVILRDGNIIEDYSQNIVEGDNFLLAKHPYNESEIGSYESGKIVGYYLAEGWKLHNGAEINFAININRDDICKDIISFFNDNFGCRVSVDVDAERHCRKVKVFSKAACEFVSSFIDGDRATEKHIKTSCFDTSSAFRQGIFDGYLETDGCKREKIFAHTTNKKLCFDMIELFATIGKYFKFRTNDKNTRYFKPDKSDLVTFTSYELKLYEPNSYDDDYFYIPIKSIESVDAKRINTVYNFTVNTSDHLYELPNGIITHQCCRLRLDLRELRRKNGGYFGSGDNTGSINVVTINLPRLAYKSKTKQEFYDGLAHLMDIAARCCDIKRKTIEQFLKQGLYPYTKRYLKSFDDHFSTIATVGMNEMCLNAKWINDTIASKEGHEFSVEVLNFMRNRLSDYQEKYGCLFNLESAPAESTSGRFAMHDKKDFPDIITAGDKTEGAPYYTNSSHLPVGYTDDIFEALDHQDDLQTKYTSGTVFHAFLGEKLPSWQAAMNLTRKIAENYKLPYFTFSPTYSICQEHGYLVGEQWKCPHCGKDTEVYSRVTGYYRAVQNFNDGKAHEFKDRKEYTNFSREFKSTPVQTEEQEVNEPEDIKLERPILFTTSTCPNCKIVKQLLAEYDFVYDLVVADQDMETARKFDINQAPTLVVQDEEGNLIKIANVSNIKKFIEEAMADIEE